MENLPIRPISIRSIRITTVGCGGYSFVAFGNAKEAADVARNAFLRLIIKLCLLNLWLYREAVIERNSDTEGNRFSAAPCHAATLWTAAPH